MLTEARIELRGCAGAPTSTAGGGAGTEHGDEVGAGALRAPGWHGSTQGGLAGRIRGSGVTGGEEMRWRRCLPAAWGSAPVELW